MSHFELSSKIAFNVEDRFIPQHFGNQNVIINEGVYKNAADFDQRVKNAIKGLKLKRADIEIKITRSTRCGRGLFYHGSVVIEAEWPSKASGAVKRESDG